MAADITFSGSIPENYDRFLGPMLFEPYAVDLVSRINHSNITSVLELACGTGRVTRHLVKNFSPTTKITASDLNPGMIAVAKRQVPEPSIDWLTADMQDLPFKDNVFDVAVCQYGIMFVPDKPKAIREIARVLKRGGVFYFNTWDKIENNGVPRIARQVVTDYYNGAQPEFYALPFSMYEPDVLRALLLGNGFSDVQISLVKKEGVSPSAHDAARGIIEGNPFFNELLAKDPTAVEKIGALVRKEIGATYGNDPMRCPLQAWVGSATK